MTVNSKQKGARYERELASYFRDCGYSTRRSAQYCGNTGDAADVVGLPFIHVEAKHQETLRLKDWIDQAVHDATGDRLPAVFHRKNNEKTLVTMRLDDWMELYKGYEKSRKECIKTKEHRIFTCSECGYGIDDSFTTLGGEDVPTYCPNCGRKVRGTE